MILIKSIDYFEVRGDIYQHLRDDWPNGFIDVNTPDGPGVVSIKAVMETIKGRRYTRPDGREIVMGVSEQAQEIIGLQYEAWENTNKLIMEQSLTITKLNREIESCKSELDDASSEVERAKDANLWQRIKWVFTGYKATNP